MRESQSSKSKWKNSVTGLVSFFPSWVMVLKLPKLGKKSKSSWKIYLNPSERSQHALSETSMF